MNIFNISTIANFLTTDKKYKGHGYWLTYEDEKIKITYDTYYPNLHVYIKINGKEETVLNWSGHGYAEEYHPGAWEKYCDEVLFPKAILAKESMEKARKEREEAEKLAKFGPIDDSKIFN